jgi:hypothetical protein
VRQPEFLFLTKDLGTELQNRITEAKQEIDRMDADRLLNTTVTDLVQALVEKYGTDDIEIHEDRMAQLPTTEARIDVTGNPMFFHPRQGGRHIVDGTRVQFALPFSGHPALFTMKPSTFFLGNGPQGLITDDGEIILTFENVNPTPEQIRQYFNHEMQLLRTSVANVNSDLKGWRSRLPQEIEQAIQNRRQRLERDRNLNGVLGLPVRQYQNPPKLVPVVRKRLGMKRIEQRPGEPHQDEWMIDEVIYEEIIDVVRSTGLAFERAHKTSSKSRNPS